jgi:hypothetical protein
MKERKSIEAIDKSEMQTRRESKADTHAQM